MWQSLFTLCRILAFVLLFIVFLIELPKQKIDAEFIVCCMILLFSLDTWQQVVVKKQK